MLHNMRELSEELDIDPQNPKPGDNEQLQIWCFDHISRDSVSEESFQENLALAEKFFHFIEHSGHDLVARIPALGNYTPVQYAALHGFHYFLQDSDLLEDAVSQNLNVYRDGMPPLHLAATKGHINTTDVLLNAGADASMQDRRGKTAAHCALLLAIGIHLMDKDKREQIKNQREQIIYRLLEKRPQLIAEVDGSGNSILHEAAANGFTRIATEVLNRNVDLVKNPNNHGKCPIHSAILNGKHDIVEIFLRIPDILDVKDSKQRNAIQFTACYGDEKMMSLFDEKLNCRDSQGRTPFMLAALYGNTEALEVLFNHQEVDPKLVDSRGYSALHLAIEAQKHEAIHWLLKHTDLDINQQTEQGLTPYDLAKEEAEKEFIKERGGRSGNGRHLQNN